MTFARCAVWLAGMVVLTAPAFAQSPGPGQALARLRAEYPGVRVLEHTGLVRAVCARPMTSAATPQMAADGWLRQYVGVFGAGSPELTLESSRRISGGKHALTYRQHVGGLPIEGSGVKLVVHEQGVSRVVYVGAKVAAVPPGGFGPPAVASAEALAAARAHPSAANLPNWRAPELMVVFADPTLREIDGVLDIFDYMAFQRLFMERDPTACDCDTSSGPGLCDLFDFLCFQNAFVAGCP